MSTVSVGGGSTDDTLKETITSELGYLDKRADFWRQQKPIYARKNEARQLKAGNTMRKTTTGGRKKNTKYVLHCLEEIDEALEEGKAAQALQQCKKLFKSLEGTEIADKVRILSNLYK